MKNNESEVKRKLWIGTQDGTQSDPKKNTGADAITVCAEAVIAARHIIAIDNIFFLMLLSLMIGYLRKQMSMVLHLLFSSDRRSAHLACHCQASSCPLPISGIRRINLLPPLLSKSTS